MPTWKSAFHNVRYSDSSLLAECANRRHALCLVIKCKSYPKVSPWLRSQHFILFVIVGDHIPLFIQYLIEHGYCMAPIHLTRLQYNLLSLSNVCNRQCIQNFFFISPSGARHAAMPILTSRGNWNTFLSDANSIMIEFSLSPSLFHHTFLPSNICPPWTKKYKYKSADSHSLAIFFFLTDKGHVHTTVTNIWLNASLALSLQIIAGCGLRYTLLSE